VAADALHLVAASTWAGVLAVAALAARRHRAAVRGALRSFARVGAACLTAIVVTGVYLTSGVVGSVDAALFTWYGRAVLLKVGLLGLVAALAATNHRRIRHWSRSWRATVGVEALVLGLALGTAAFLTSGQPAREPEFVARTQPAPSRAVDAQVADLQERVQLGPNRPGRDVAVVDVFNTRRPAPAPIERVSVRVVSADGAGPAPVTATPLSISGRWSATVAVPSAGRLAVEVTVFRAGMPPVRHAFDWVAGGFPAVTRPARVSTAPLDGTLRGLSLVLLAVVVLGAAALTRRRRPELGPRPGRPAPVDPQLTSAQPAERATSAR
jgi:copper transport protein